MKGSIKDGILYAIIFWCASLLVGAILLDKAIMPWAAGHFQKSTSVPNVTGKSVKDASEIMKNVGLKVAIAPEKRNSGLPEGMVMQQIPSSGREVKTGRVIQLILSAGSKELIMQNFRGTSIASAEQQLAQLGLKYSIQYVNDPHVPPGNVVRTQPEANSIVSVETNILLVVAEGVPLPNFLGKDLEASKSMIDSLQLNLRVITVDSATNGTSGQIIDQKPKPGSMVRKNEAVTLTVNP